MSWTIEDRTLAARQTTRKDGGLLTTFHLEEVRDHLRKLVVAQDAMDETVAPCKLRAEFIGGQMLLQWPGSARGRVTTTAATHLAREILPARFWAGLKQLAYLDPQTATTAWNRFAERAGTDGHVLRTVRMQDREGRPSRVTRAFVTTKYAPYSNLQLVEDMLSHAGHYSRWPVLDWRLTDDGMRLRFAGLDNATELFASFDTSVILNTPLPMVEVWNSETGCRAVHMLCGVWRLLSASGFHSWADRDQRSWQHRGALTAFPSRVLSVFGTLTTAAKMLCDDYTNAMKVEIVDSVVWMAQQLAVYDETKTDTFLALAKKALEDPRTGPGDTLAGVVDAVALAAQDRSDMFTQYEIERIAGRLLSLGLRAAAASADGRLRPEVEGEKEKTGKIVDVIDSSAASFVPDAAFVPHKAA